MRRLVTMQKGAATGRADQLGKKTPLPVFC